MSAVPQSQPADIDLSAILRSIRRSFLGLLAASIGVGAVTYGAFSTMAPRYQSEAQIAIAAKSTNPYPDARDRQGDSLAPRLDKEAVNTHVRAMTSPELVLRVSRDLDLARYPEFNSAAGDLDTWNRLLRMVGFAGPRASESDDDRVLSVVSRQLEVSAARESRFISIRFSSADQALAAEFANRLAESYRSGLVTRPVQETSELVAALSPKIDQLKREVIEADAEVERYRASTDQFRGGTQSESLRDQRMAALNAELVRTETQRSEAESRWRTAHELAQNGSAEVLPDVQRSPLIMGLINQRVRLERDIAAASAGLLPQHPDMKRLRADVAGLKQQIAAEVARVVQSLEKDYRAAALRVESAQREIASLKTKVVSGSGNEARLRSLIATADAKRQELERLQKQIEDNKTIVNIQRVPIEAQIVSRARPSGVPFWPRKGPFTLLAAGAAFMLSLAVVIVRALPVLGGTGAPASAAPVNVFARPAPRLEPMGPVAHAGADLAAPLDTVDAIVARILARNDLPSGVRAIITGATSSVDASAEAFAIAEALAARGKRVILIGWRLDDGALAMRSKGTGGPGFLDLLEGRAAFEDVIRRMRNSSAHHIPAGTGTDRSLSLDGDNINLILDALDETYQYILVAASRQDGAQLFEAIEGRFDCGVSICDPHAVSTGDTADTFLGYDVTDIDVVTFQRSVQKPAGDRLSSLRTGTRARSEAPA